MAFFRTLLAAMIAFGLVFAPAAASAKMPARSTSADAAVTAAAMDGDCPHHKAAAKTAAPSEMPCPSGDMGKCDTAFCALKCFKIAAVFPVPGPQHPIYAAPAEYSMPEALVSIAWRPSTPPPRS